MIDRGCGQEGVAAGFVLAGGRSSRMGSEKALVEFDGRPLLAHALAILRDAGLEAAIAGAQTDLSQFAPVVPDAQSGLGPLAGICAALASTWAEHGVFLSVDQPNVPCCLIRYLLLHARTTGRAITLASINGYPQTFPAVVRRGALPVLEHELREGRRGCYSAFSAAAIEAQELVTVLPVESLVQAGHLDDPNGLPAARWFSNLNTPVDLDRAMAYGSARSRVI